MELILIFKISLNEAIKALNIMLNHSLPCTSLFGFNLIPSSSHFLTPCYYYVDNITFYHYFLVGVYMFGQNNILLLFFNHLYELTAS